MIWESNEEWLKRMGKKYRKKIRDERLDFKFALLGESVK